ncbi:MAG: sporulation protein YtfJ [Oscillospiraceae bacterium]|jgi:sporulation protein YtfJ|nr:sporulation protein YtfJ [Oscillospiraceae bacterium]
MAGNLQGLMNDSLDKIKQLVDVNTIVGTPIISPDGTVVIPVSKVSFGFVSGGTDLPTKVPQDIFAGGSGAGVTIKPEAFIVIKSSGDVALLELNRDSTTIESLIEGAPELFAKIKGMFAKKDTEKSDD